MQSTISEVAALTIIISTVLIVVFGGCIIYFLFMYQRKRFRHQQEMLELREAFNQTLLVSKIEIQEQTLDHISKELHANFSHLVSLININLSEILPQSSEGLRENVIETKALAKQLLGELKALSASLNTDHIMKIGFVRALENELTRLRKIMKYKIQFNQEGEEFILQPERAIILFRLCQEVLNNVVQYAKATSISASLKFGDENLILVIEDDGIGFNLSLAQIQGAEKESTGLLNIKKRANIIHGQVEVESTEGLGTKVRITIPR